MQDEIKKFLAYKGRISITCINTTELVEETRKIHDLSPVVTAAFGRLITITALMGNEMKNTQDKLTVKIKGNGPIGTMLITANNVPEVKGYVENSIVDIPLNDIGKLDVGSAVGNTGYIYVVKNIGLKEPYIGISTLKSGEIADDFAEYFSKSEQKQTAVALGVLIDKNGVKSAGGYIVTPMPDATETDISNVEKAIFEAGAISKMLDSELTLKEIAIRVTGDENVEIISENITPKYKCNCSKEKMKTALNSLNIEELKDIVENKGTAEVVCNFCNKKYLFTEEELEM